jgi:mRNA interferase RelE/StbE
MYEIRFTERAIKDLNKMDPAIGKMIFNWLEKNLSQAQNPREKGKALSKEKKGAWRYRVGDYRILARINDHELLILVIQAGHRKDVYR